MTAVSVHASQSSHVPHLSWLRISAWSGSFSLHLAILALLLVPPVAIEMARQQPDKQQSYRIIDPPKVQPEPDLPMPVRHQSSAPVKHVAVRPVTPPISTERSEMSYDAPVVDTPPAIDNKPAVDTEPSAITYGKQTRVPYPRDSLLNREQGTVILRVLVSAAGLVQSVEIEKTSGWPRLDRAARDAVKGWSFHPSTHGGVAQSAWALVPVTFNLQQL